METQLANLHAVLALAAQDPQLIPKDDVFQIRIDSDLKEAAEAIIRRNGATPSAFIRKCYEVLVQEYTEG